ncbi:MAG: hypothetical protein JO112_00225, partial [Planctomycetes bacterium]|nr:hypothetical protein [Planctomycetota bacterium]
AVLAALTTAAVMRFSTTGPRWATTSNLSKVLLNINTQWKAVREQAASESKTSAANQPFLTQAQNKYAGKSAVDPSVKAEYVRLKLVQAFPTSFAEALAPAGNASLAWPNYVRYLSNLGVTSVNDTTPLEIQSAVCVLMILEVGPKNTEVGRDELRTTAVGQLKLANGKTAQGIVDGWRHAVLFTRGYNNQLDQAPAFLSAGADGKFGAVNTTTFQPTANDPAVTDNIVVNNP